jgi:acetoin utilization deacetylase AcuC-like enzyme/GNAT superfamily N-acetyltransferase
MFRIRKIHDHSSIANKNILNQVSVIMKEQFPLTRQKEISRLLDQMHDPIRYKYRSVLFIAEDDKRHINGFAILLYMPDINICYLEYISTAKGLSNSGIGGALYLRVKDEAKELGAKGLFFECSIDDEKIIKDEKTLKQNKARMRFYEKFDVYPIINNEYASPVTSEDIDLYFLMYDSLDCQNELSNKTVREVVEAILARKYGDLFDSKHIQLLLNTFKDDPIKFRKPLYTVKRKNRTLNKESKKKIPIIVNEKHSIHHVKDKGYVEAPVRIETILEALDMHETFAIKEALIAPLKLLRKVHDNAYISYLKQVAQNMKEDESYYAIVFPLRNALKPPKDLEVQAGYYCSDTFTPFHKNVYLAAKGAVDCAYTASNYVLNGEKLSYALVRPPGHHAERRASGGFCYFNSSAVAAEFLSDYGKVAILDIDYHHGNGTQEIFYKRSDVLTLSIHGDPKFSYPYFSGFTDEKGEGEGKGFNINYPLPEQIEATFYHEVLAKALKSIKKFAPSFLIIGLGLDTAKDDPTGTWGLYEEDFFKIGVAIASLKLPTVVIQEGGYLTQTLGVNAKSFFDGIQNK